MSTLENVLDRFRREGGSSKSAVLAAVQEDFHHAEERDPDYVGECHHCGLDVFDDDAMTFNGHLFHKLCREEDDEQ